MAQEATKDSLEMEQLKDQVELAKKKLDYTSIEYGSLKETLAKAQKDKVRLVGDCTATTNYYKAMRDAKDKMELEVVVEVKEAQAAKDEAANLATKLGVAQVKLEEERKRNK